MMNLRANAPPAVWGVGSATVAPILIATGVFCYGPAQTQQSALWALIAFSAVLLAYLGGIRAGWEVERPQPRWTVTGLSLLAPVGASILLFLTPTIGPAWMIGGLLAAHIAQWAWDATTHDGPDWRPRMRTFLTAATALSLAFALEQALHI